VEEIRTAALDLRRSRSNIMVPALNSISDIHVIFIIPTTAQHIVEHLTRAPYEDLTVLGLFIAGTFSTDKDISVWISFAF